jgi:hypothetical protein
MDELATDSLKMNGVDMGTGRKLAYIVNYWGCQKVCVFESSWVLYTPDTLNFKR